MQTNVEQKSERLAIRIRPSIKEEAEALAASEERTLSSWIERAIRDAIERAKKSN